MGDIAWTDRTWNPTAGCSVHSPGCTNCYAMKMTGRLELMGQAKYAGLTTKTKAGHVFNGTVRLDESALDLPLRWRKPARVFVNSMSDLFHEALTDDAIDRVFAVMALAQQHTFQVLTKRADRMRAYLEGNGLAERVIHAAYQLDQPDGASIASDFYIGGDPILPLPNVWLGVSVEDQERADERIPGLLATPAAVRFLSCEPLLGPLDLGALCTGHYFIDALKGRKYHDAPHTAPTEAIAPIDWVIVGGESGPRARPMEMRWLHDVVSQCQAAKVAVFVKQLGAKPVAGGVPYARYVAGAERDQPIKDRKCADLAEWPAYLRIQEFPA